MINLLRMKARQLRETLMGKPTRKPKGKSARKGNQPSPYTKYNKSPYVYSAAYHAWRRDRLSGRSSLPKPFKVEDREHIRELKAAE